MGSTVSSQAKYFSHIESDKLQKKNAWISIDWFRKRAGRMLDNGMCSTNSQINNVIINIMVKLELNQDYFISFSIHYPF